MGKRAIQIAELCGMWLAAVVSLTIVVAACGALVRVFMWAAGF